MPRTYEMPEAGHVAAFTMREVLYVLYPDGRVFKRDELKNAWELTAIDVPDASEWWHRVRSAGGVVIIDEPAVELHEGPRPEDVISERYGGY